MRHVNPYAERECYVLRRTHLADGTLKGPYILLGAISWKGVQSFLGLYRAALCVSTQSTRKVSATSVHPGLGRVPIMWHGHSVPHSVECVQDEA